MLGNLESIRKNHNNLFEIFLFNKMTLNRSLFIKKNDTPTFQPTFVRKFPQNLINPLNQPPKLRDHIRCNGLIYNFYNTLIIACHLIKKG